MWQVAGAEFKLEFPVPGTRYPGQVPLKGLNFAQATCNIANVECGHSQGINFVALILLQRSVKHNRNVGRGHSQEYNVGTPSAVSSHRVEGALRPKYHVRANVALRGHCADRMSVSWKLLASRESTLFTLMILSERVKHNRNVACGHSQEPNFVARHPLKACKTQLNR
jgi:hypothetical protein